jgi:hypothetical protein
VVEGNSLSPVGGVSRFVVKMKFRLEGGRSMKR